MEGKERKAGREVSREKTTWVSERQPARCGLRDELVSGASRSKARRLQTPLPWPRDPPCVFTSGNVSSRPFRNDLALVKVPTWSSLKGELNCACHLWLRNRTCSNSRH